MHDDAGSSFTALRKRLAFSIHSKISGAFKKQDPYMYFEVLIWTSLPVGQKEMRRSSYSKSEHPSEELYKDMNAKKTETTDN